MDWLWPVQVKHGKMEIVLLDNIVKSGVEVHPRLKTVTSVKQEENISPPQCMQYAEKPLIVYR